MTTSLELHLMIFEGQLELLFDFHHHFWALSVLFSVA